VMCESCKTSPAYGKPVGFPEVPMVYSLCASCQGAGVIPYELLVTWVWLGKIKSDNAWARNIAIYHGISGAEFESDCANYIDKMDEAWNE